MPDFQRVQEVLRRFTCIADQAGKENGNVAAPCTLINNIILTTFYHHQ
jgi:hypothetical protein